MKKLISMAFYGLLLIAAISCSNSRNSSDSSDSRDSSDYYSACEKHDFQKAHRFLHEMHEDIVKKMSENGYPLSDTFNLWAGWYKEYITAANTVYEEEVKFLLDQEGSENNPRIKVLMHEYASWVNQTSEELNGMESQYESSGVYKGEFKNVKEHYLVPKAQQLRLTVQNVAKAYNNEEISELFNVDENEQL